jgi:Skp family chaperone for outer membrane proteins
MKIIKTIFLQKKFITLKFLTLILMSCTAFVNANASNIAILDLEKIIKDSKAMRDIQNKVNKKQDEYQKEVSKKQNDLENEQKTIEAKKAVLSKDGFEKEVQKFEKKVDDLKTYVDRKQNSLKKASMESMSKVNEIIKEIIGEISKDKNYEVIIPASQTVFFEDSLDISEEVLKKLDKKITKVDVKFE